MSKPTFILFGATGDLAKQKILPILNNSESDIVLYSRKPTETQFTSVVGDLDNLQPLVVYFRNQPVRKLFFYLALPPDLYISTIESIHRYFKNQDAHIALEKPFGSSLENAEKLANVVKAIGEEKFYIIDHYLAKETLITNTKRVDLEKVKTIEVTFLEKETVSERGKFYDAVGAIKDVGQNHMLNMLAEFINPQNKLEVLSNLKYVQGSLHTKQYEGYKLTEGVDPNSTTETYFKAQVDYKDKKILFEAGKNMPTTKTSIKVTYLDGTNYELVVKPNPKETKTAHEYVIDDFLSGENKYSLSMLEALVAWKITEDILHDKKD